MGLLARIVGVEQRPAPLPVTRALDLRPTERRISRPVTYVGTASGTSSRAASLARAVESGFAGSAHAYACVQAIATNAASLDLVVERENAQGEREPIPGHPVAVLWNRRPNPLVSARIFKETLWAQLELVGEAFVYLDRGPAGTGEVQAMYPIFDPVEVVVDRNVAGTLQGFRVTVQGGQRVPLLPAEVLWLRYPHPREPWGCMAPFRAAQFALELDGWAKAWQQGELRNGARPEGVVYLGDVDPDTHDEIVSDFRSRHEGPENAGRHLFLSGDKAGAYSRIGLTAAEVSYKDTRDGNAEEVFLAFRVPRDYLLGGTTYENRTAARQTLWSDAILPKLEVVASEVDRQLLPDLAESCRFDTSEVDALRENEDAIALRVVAAMNADLLTVDEGRDALGLEPLPGGVGEQTLTFYRKTTDPTAPGDGQVFTPPPAFGAPAPNSDVADPQDEADDAAQVPAQRPAAERATRKTGRKAKPLSRPAILREYDRVERIGVREVQRLARRMKRQVLAAAERSTGKSNGRALQAAVASYDLAAPGTMDRYDLEREVREHVEDVFDVRYWTEIVRDALGDTLVAAAYDAGATTTAASLGLSFDLIDPQVEQAMRNRADVLASQVTLTTRDALERALLEPGVAEGESVPDLAARLTSVFDNLEGWRAETIARTETVGGFNNASRTAAVASGVAVAREWLATSDARTRDTHAALDGYRTETMGDLYPNGLMHPGDPDGSPDETVNCRCVETYVLSEDE